MNKHARKLLAVMSVVAVILAGINLIDTHRGQALHCFGGMSEYDSRQTTYGLPFTYFIRNSEGNSCEIKATSQFVSSQIHRYDFRPLWFAGDILVAFAVLIGVYKYVTQGWAS